MTALLLMAALAVPVIAGMSLVLLVCPRLKLGITETLFVISLGIPVGFGVLSLVLFLWLVATNGQTKGATMLLVSVGVLLAAAAIARQRRGSRVSLDRSSNPEGGPRWLAPALAFAVLMTIGVVVLTAIAQPHGGWDAWYTWNHRAIFMQHGGIHWRDAFSAPEAGWNADYPLMTPGAVASGWLIFGRESLLVSNAIGLLFTIAPIGLLVSTVSFLRSRTQGLLAGVLLAFSPQLAVQGAAEQADIPLASFYLGAISLLGLYDSIGGDGQWLVLSGALAGMAAWTKNEGLLFVLALCFVRAAVVTFSSGWKAMLRQAVRFGAGLLPVLAVIVFFKLRVVDAGNDLVRNQSASAELQRLFAFGRYWYTSKTILAGVLDVGGWMFTIPVWLVMYLLLAGVNTQRRERLPIATGALTLAVMMVGHFFVYVLTPHDLAWQIRGSLPRILMQLWPTAILTFLLVAKTIEEQREVDSSKDTAIPTASQWDVDRVGRQPAPL
jgi:hypothetical protein